MGIKKLHSNAVGNSIFEMVVFLPVALLFGILASDAAFSVTDRAVITDAIRGGLGDYKIAGLTANISIFKDGTDTVSYANTVKKITDPEINEEFLNFLAARIFKNIADTRKESEQELLETIQVNVHAVLVRINSTTGFYNGFDVIKSVSYGGNNAQLNTQLNTGANSTIHKTLSGYNHISVSPFAARNITIDSPILTELNSHESAKYHDYTVIIFADATVLTRNTNTELRKIFYSTYNTQRYAHFVKL